MDDPKPQEREITNWSCFLWAWLKDAFGKAWWVVGLVTVVLPLLSGFVHEDEPGWGKNACFEWLHDHADFTIPFWGAVLVCVWRVLRAPYDLFKNQKKKADDSLAKLVAVENDKIGLKIDFEKSPDLGHPIYIVRVRNTHPYRTAKRVKVFLDTIEANGLDKKLLNSMGWPRRLPLKGQHDPKDCDIDASPSGQEFELLFAQNRMGLEWYLVFSPSVKGLPLTRVEQASSCIIKSQHVNATENESFVFTITAQGEDIHPKTESATMIVPPQIGLTDAPYFQPVTP